MELKRFLREKKNPIFIILSLFFLFLAVFILMTSVDGNDGDNTIEIGTFSDSFWEVQNGYSYRILEDAIDLFEKENPGVKVKFTSGLLKEDYSEWLSGKILSEEAPDLFFILPEDFNELVELGALMNLNPFLRVEGDSFRENFYASAFNNGLFNNAHYALPYECAPKLMFVNESLLEREGIPTPKENWSWEDFYTISKKVTKDTNGDNVTDQFGYIGYNWSDAFDSNGVELFSQKGDQCNLSGENVTESLEFVEKLEQISPSVTNRDFDLGNVAFQPMSFSEFRAYQPYPLSLKKYSNFKWSCIPMPRGPSGKNISSLQCLQLGINSKTHHRDLSWKFLKFLTSKPEIQKEIFDYSEGVSVLKSVTETDQTLGKLIDSSNSNLTQEILSSAVENAVIPPHFRNYDLALLQVDSAISDTLNGDSNIDMKLINWNRSINKQLKNRLID